MPATPEPIPLLLSTLALSQPPELIHMVCAEVMSPEKQEALLDVIKEANPCFESHPEKRAYFQVERDKPVMIHLLQAIEEGTIIDAVRSVIIRGDARDIEHALEIALKDNNRVIGPEDQAFADFLVKLNKWKLNEERGNSEIDYKISSEFFFYLKQPNGQAIVKGVFKLFGSDWVHQAVFKVIQLHECFNRRELSNEEKDFLLDQCDASARPDLLGKLLASFIDTESISGCNWVLGKKNFNVNYADERGRSLLSKALWKKNMDLANRLLDRGADIWQKDQDGYTPVNISGYVSPTQWRLYKHLLLQRTLYTIAGLIASIGLTMIFASVLNGLNPPQSRTYQWIR
ncbi:MAG: hypothetical protein H7A38_02140 [Chlamydiales bacterium]|nr:hypothetical protein [Chlamydiales bacterium]